MKGRPKRQYAVYRTRDGRRVFLDQLLAPSMEEAERSARATHGADVTVVDVHAEYLARRRFHFSQKEDVPMKTHYWDADEGKAACGTQDPDIVTSDWNEVTCGRCLALKETREDRRRGGREGLHRGPLGRP